MKRRTILSWALRVTAASILLQTLFFKFSGAAESVYIFSTLGIEPWGRIGTGVIELIASALLLVPRTVSYGALLSLAVMTGAMVGHLTKLGISIPAVNDNGELFLLALVVFACSLVLIALHGGELRQVLRRRARRDGEKTPLRSSTADFTCPGGRP